MIEGLKPYPAYKDSDVPWLGTIPTHWTVQRNKRFLREVNDRSDTGSEELLTVSQYTGVTKRRNRLGAGGDLLTRAESLVGYKQVQPGDIVINIMLAWNGSLGVSAEAGITSTAYCVFRRTAAVEPRYLHYLLRTPLMTGVFKTVSTGVVDSRLRLYPDAFLGLTSVLPPLEEQVAIVRFTDHVDRQIRRFISAKQKLIKLLDEQKRAIIGSAVMRGTTRSGALHPLGSAPEFDVNVSWPVVRLRSVARLRSEKASTSMRLLSVFLGRGVIPYEDGGGQVHKPSLDLSAYQVVRPGDLVLNNQQAWRGSVGVTSYEGIVSPAYVVLTLDDRLDARFAGYLFSSSVMVSQFVTASKGVGTIQRDVHMPWLMNVRLPLPTLQHQREIVVHLEAQLETIRRETERYAREVDLLQEYRVRLVGDVVTGKLDVRAAAANLSGDTSSGEQAEESLDEALLEHDDEDDAGVPDDEVNR